MTLRTDQAAALGAPASAWIAAAAGPTTPKGFV